MTGIPRRATLDDLEVLLEGNLRMAAETESLALDPDVVRAGIAALLEGRQPGRYYLVEVEDRPGQPAAQLLITYEWSDWRNGRVWWIQSVYTWPEVRGQGVFRRLFEAVERDARDAGAVGIRLYVDRSNDTAQQVYRRLGMDGDHYRLFELMF